MPISVVCPGCQARFAVSEKFAGKKGPCPKCKVLITIPDAPAEDVKIHVPEEFASGGKDATGRAVLKPIARKETKLSATNIALIAGAIVLVIALAVLVRFLGSPLPVVAGGLIVISPALAVAGYTFLRDDELEPHRGKALMLRAVLCGLGYASLWGVYMLLAQFGIISGEAWRWFFLGPGFVVVGAGIALACLDLDFGSAAMHFCFFVAVTLLLRFAVGLPAVWAVGEAPFY